MPAGTVTLPKERDLERVARAVADLIGRRFTGKLELDFSDGRVMQVRKITVERVREDG